MTADGLIKVLSNNKFVVFVRQIKLKKSEDK